MIDLGYQLGKELPSSSVVCLFGNLGAGKTTLVKGIASAASGIEVGNVNSPTFVYLNIYEGPKTVYHFDLYRLGNVDEFLNMGFDDLLFSDGVCCIEWSERIQQILPPSCIKISIEHVNENARSVRIHT